MSIGKKACLINFQNFRSGEFSLLSRDTFTTACMSSRTILFTIWIKLESTYKLWCSSDR